MSSKSQNAVDKRGFVRPYIRVSTFKQVNKGVSMEEQLYAIQQWAKLRNLEVTAEYKDAGKSGKTRKERPRLQECIDALQPDDIFAVKSLSRMARSCKDALSILNDIEEKKASLLIIDSEIDTKTIAGRLLFNILSAVAQMEGEMISERTHAAMSELIRQGKPLGRPCYGLVDVPDPKNPEKKMRVTEETEQKNIGIMLKWRKQGCTFQDIADLLVKEKILPREKAQKGKGWTASGVAKIVNDNIDAL